MLSDASTRRRSVIRPVTTRHFPHLIRHILKQEKHSNELGSSVTEAQQDEVPQVPTQREALASGSYGIRALNVFSEPRDVQIPCVGGTNDRDSSTSSRTARSGRTNRRPSGPPSCRRPEGYRALPGGGTASRSRSCSPMSGAARRSSIFSQPQTSEARQAHWWQKKQRPAKPQSGRAGNIARSN